MANDPREILKYVKDVLSCDIHSRHRTKRILEKNGANIVKGMFEIMNKPNEDGGYNERYGLLGCNKATEEKIKLFPRDCFAIVENIQKEFKKRTGKDIEVMIYGDGAFKDPVGKIWELADPVVSPGYTKGLEGRPNEIKLKYLADNNFSDLKGENLKQAVSEYIRNKKKL